MDNLKIEMTKIQGEIQKDRATNSLEHKSLFKKVDELKDSVDTVGTKLGKFATQKEVQKVKKDVARLKKYWWQFMGAAGLGLWILNKIDFNKLF